MMTTTTFFWVTPINKQYFVYMFCVNLHIVNVYAQIFDNVA